MLFVFLIIASFRFNCTRKEGSLAEGTLAGNMSEGRNRRYTGIHKQSVLAQTAGAGAGTCSGAGTVGAEAAAGSCSGTGTTAGASLGRCRCGRTCRHQGRGF